MSAKEACPCHPCITVLLVKIQFLPLQVRWNVKEEILSLEAP